jgi:DNA-binding beta-propeller fold protein YncE
VTADGTTGSETGVQVFTPAAGGGLQSSCVNLLPSSLVSEGAAPANLDFTPNGVDIGGGIGAPGAVFYNTAALMSCAASGVLLSQGPIAANEDTLETLVTPDQKYAFVINQDGVASGAILEGNVGVVQLQLDANGNVTGGTLLGQIATGGAAIAGIALSPDGARLYVTTGVAGTNTQASGSSNSILYHSGCSDAATGGTSITGLLTVINVAEAEADPGSGAILTAEAAGCNPVRVVESTNESVLWVSARGDDRVLAFNPSALESNPNNALLGYAATGGTAPIGLRLFDKDQLLAVANSNRFDTGTANLTILYVANPAQASVIQTVPTGMFPREVTVGSDDATLYLTNSASDTLQVITTTVN